MSDLDTREWLLTNGLGGFASGTVSDLRTRTYHGWLFHATNPPSGRKLLLSHLEASLEIEGQNIALGTNIWGTGEITPSGYQLLQSFEFRGQNSYQFIPTWTWGKDDWLLTRQLVMPYGLNKAYGINHHDWRTIFSTFNDYCPMPDTQRILIQYDYQGAKLATLRLRLLICDRDFHHQQTHHEKLQFSQLLGNQQVCFQAIDAGKFGIPWHIHWSRGEYHSHATWYWNYQLSEETKRGLSDHEDLYSPGYLLVNLCPGDKVTLEARLGFPLSGMPIISPQSFSEAIASEQERFCRIFSLGISEKSASSPLVWRQLLRASDQFIVYRGSISGPTVIAGYHWFNDWGRDTLIALPGLTLTTGRFELAKGLLRTLGSYCRFGLIPNAFPDLDGEPFYNSIDAALWWVEALGLYLETTQDWQFLSEQFPVAQQIYKAFIGGTRYNINVDATDKLVGWDASSVALTWMDAIIGGIPVTHRLGKPIEINALWYSALCWLTQWSERLSRSDVTNSARLAKQTLRYHELAEQVQTSLQKYWNPQLGYLYDTIEPDDKRNAQIRPNAVLALSLHHCAFPQAQGCRIIDLATSSLLTPYGLRSLDPNDPQYQGKYFGNPEERDRAYHQGTVWSWLIGPYMRAWERFYPQVPPPFDWQPLIDHFFSSACIGSISEIFDGDAPHVPRGAIAQAWSIGEVIRHLPEEFKRSRTPTPDSRLPTP